MEAPFGPNAGPVLAARYLARDLAGRATESPHQMLERVARAVAGVEPAAQAGIWAQRFYRLMASGRFLPNSPTLMNAGRPLGQLAACFVLPVPDSLEGIFEALKHSALIHKSGGGTGFSFSRLRPVGDQVASTGGVSSGPLSFMTVFDTATEAVKQGGTRRGANMAMLEASHPDIEAFIAAKTRPGVLENFNLSVMAPDAFLAAAQAGEAWALVNPRDGHETRRLPAAGLLERLAAAAHASGEPGLAFRDAINRANPTPQLGALEATNPCGEQPLLPYESCNLGSLNLAAFQRGGEVDFAALEEAAQLAVRFLDNVIDLTRFPLPQVEKATLATRKVGLGVMGWADLLAGLDLPYGGQPARDLGAAVMAAIGRAAWAASAELGRARGDFPAFAQGALPARGLTHARNATVTTIAPTGTISLLLGASSGIEPFYALAYTRAALDGRVLEEQNPRFLARLAALGRDLEADRRRLAARGRAADLAGAPPELVAAFPTALEIAPADHVRMQAAFQDHTDNGVSKTVNLPAEATVDQVRQVFLLAWSLGLKGITVYRQGSRGAQVLRVNGPPGRGLPLYRAACPPCEGA